MKLNYFDVQMNYTKILRALPYAQIPVDLADIL